MWANWDIDELKARTEKIQAGSELSIGLIGWPFHRDDWKFSAQF